MPTSSGRRSSAASSRASLQVGEKDVEVKLQASNKEEPPAIEYKLRPVLFLVPQGAAPDRLRGAQARCRSAARPLHRAATRACVSRWRCPTSWCARRSRGQSADLGQQQRDVLNNTPIGRLTPPDVTPQGVEVFAVCSKTPAVGGDSPARRAGARRDVQRAISGAVEEIPRKNCAARR